MNARTWGFLALLAMTAVLLGCSSGSSKKAAEDATSSNDVTTSTDTAAQDVTTHPDGLTTDVTTNLDAQDQTSMGSDVEILFLHHSTGGVIWGGGVEQWFTDYNSNQGTSYQIVEQAFPKDAPYGWNNYPFDYWNIWVNHAGPVAFTEEPTLEMLTAKQDVIVWKHCFPVSGIDADNGAPDVTSEQKTVENYKAQYAGLKTKMREFPATRFVVWTGAALTQASNSEESATRARTFFQWVKSEWDEPGDNIFVWDFYELETQDGLYLPDNFAASPDDSHPNDTLAQLAAPLFAQRVVDVIEGRGDTGKITGEP